MNRAACLILALAVTLAGCVSSSAGRVTLSRALAEQVVARAASQVQRCYRPPRVPSGGRQIVTRLRVRFEENGTLIGLPELVTQEGLSEANRSYAAPMAEAAIAAVIRCSPVVLTPE